MQRVIGTNIRALAALAGLPLSLSAHAAIIPWSNPAGGMATIGANWSGGVVPGAADTAQFTLAGPYSVTFPAGFPTITSWNAVSGTVAWNLTAPQTTASLRVAIDASSTPIATITGNTLTVTGTGGSVGLGTLAGTGIGTLNIQGGAVVRTTAANGDIVAGVVSTGHLNVSGGGRAEAADDFIVANNLGSTGTASVEGLGSTIATTSATTGDVVVALNGTGTLNVSGFGTVNAAHDLAIGVNSAGNGTVNVFDNDFPGTISVGNNCDIGRNITGGSAAGTGLMTLNGPSTVSVTVIQTTTVGDPDGGLGTLQLDGGTFTTRNLIFDATNSSFTFNDGLLVVNGGLYTPRPGTQTINGGAVGQLPTLRLSNGASCTPTGGFVIGSTRAGRMEVLSGSTATVIGGGMTIGGFASGAGTILVDGVGSSINQASSTLFVGSSGAGTLTVQNGGTASSLSARVAGNVGSTGTVTISGAGSRWDVGSSLSIGGTTTVAGGSADCTIEHGAVGTANQLILWPGSSLNINNATLTMLNEATLDGATTITNGTLIARELLESDNTNISASGRFDAHVENTARFFATITLNGPLDIGPTSATGNFTWAGRLNVGSHALSFRKPFGGTGLQFSRLGDVTIDGGSITPITPNRGSELANGDSLIGTGTINGPIRINAGATVTATGTNGLTFNGVITPHITPTFTITGTRVNIGSSGGISGAGAVNTIFNCSPGAIITTTGDLALGTNNSLGFVLIGANLNIGPHTLTLTDSNGGTIGTARLDGGIISLAGATAPGHNLNTANNGHLTGHGTINAVRFHNINGGQISPGFGADATGAGTLTINGNYAQFVAGNTPGTLNMDLAGSGAGQFDHLRVSGSAILGGTLNIALINGYAPQPGVFHDIITTDSDLVIGDFVTLNLPPGFIVIKSDNAYSVGIKCPADVDNGEGRGNPDGGVTIEDLLYYLDIFDQGLIAADVDDGSFTGEPDGGVTIDDLLFFLFRFDSGC